MPYFYHLIDIYGYWLVACGALVEGDTFLIAGGVAAQKHLLNGLNLIVISIFLSMVHDGLLFYVGRFMGIRLLKKYPKIESKMAKALKYIDKYGVLAILILRFAYGLRTLIPLAIGMGKISAKKFFFYDFLGGVIWSVSFILGGVLFGKALTMFMRKFEFLLQFFSDIDNLSILIVAVSVLIVIFIGVYQGIKRVKINQKIKDLTLKKLELKSEIKRRKD